MNHLVELSPESLSNAHHDKTLVLSMQFEENDNGSILKEQIGETIRGIAVRLTPKTPTTPKNRPRHFFPQTESRTNQVKELDILNSSFDFQNINEIIMENNDLKTYMTQVKSRFEMLLSECKEMEKNFDSINSEKENLKLKLEDFEKKEQAQKDSTNRFVKYCEQEHGQIEEKLEIKLEENKRLNEKLMILKTELDLNLKEKIKLETENGKILNEKILLEEKLKEIKKKNCPFPGCDGDQNIDNIDIKNIMSFQIVLSL
ncbi:unnamed protein product [Brachionus calyciflorus]|uniref:Uncharacterized protein n=1 Tax=Brachionus calyciflorus TaxID=104777 RepID=A0A813ZDA5_9BILA|nr:unnamed protein product [Brachionus calyciflorus]